MEKELYDKLLAASLRFISIRLRSQKELQDFLTKKLKRARIFSQTVGDAVLDRLTQLGYIDDFKFAAWWIESRTRTKPKGARAITIELRQKGIAKDVIEETIRLAHRDEAKIARMLAQRKHESWKSLPEDLGKRKLFGFLIRRGFSLEVADAVVDELFDKQYNR